MKKKQKMKKKKRRRILHAINHLKMFKNILMPGQEEDMGRRFITKNNNN